MISAALVALSLYSIPAAVPSAPVIEVRYRRHRSLRRTRRAARDLDGCCWPADREKTGFLSIEAFYDLFPAFKEGNR